MSDQLSPSPRLGLPPADWLEFFRSAKVEVDRLDAAKSRQGQITVAANFLARMVDREVRIEVDGRTGTATLRVAPGRSRRKGYYFDIVFDEEDESAAEDHPPKGPQPLDRKTINTRPCSGMEERKCQPDSPVDRSPVRDYWPAANDEAW